MTVGAGVDLRNVNARGTRIVISKPGYYAEEARKSMKSLKVYKKQFEPMIRIYGQLREQYDIYTKLLEDANWDYIEDTQQGTKKHPIITTLESLRKDILAYASQLGLTPQGLLKVQEGAFEGKKKSSALGEALKDLSSG